MQRASVLILVLAISMLAHAERGESVISTRAGVWLPDFDPTSTSAFALATYSASTSYRYGLLDDLFIGVRFGLSGYNASTGDYRYEDPRTALAYTGRLYFSGMSYLTEATLLYNLYAGYNLAPRLEVSVGYLYSTYRDAELFDENDTSYGLDIADFGEGSLAYSAGFTLDYRLWNMMFVGVGARFVGASSGALSSAIEFPLTLSLYW